MLSWFLEPVARFVIPFVTVLDLPPCEVGIFVEVLSIRLVIVGDFEVKLVADGKFELVVCAPKLVFKFTVPGELDEYEVWIVIFVDEFSWFLVAVDSAILFFWVELKLLSLNILLCVMVGKLDIVCTDSVFGIFFDVKSTKLVIVGIFDIKVDCGDVILEDNEDWGLCVVVWPNLVFIRFVEALSIELNVTVGIFDVKEARVCWVEAELSVWINSLVLRMVDVVGINFEVKVVTEGKFELLFEILFRVVVDGEFAVVVFPFCGIFVVFFLLIVEVWVAGLNLLVWVIGIFWVRVERLGVDCVNWLLMIFDVMSIRLLVTLGIFDVDCSEVIELGVWIKRRDVVRIVGIIFEVKTETDGKLEIVFWAPVDFRLVWAPGLVFKFTVDGAFGVVVNPFWVEDIVEAEFRLTVLNLLAWKSVIFCEIIETFSVVLSTRLVTVGIFDIKVDCWVEIIFDFVVLSMFDVVINFEVEPETKFETPVWIPFRVVVDGTLSVDVNPFWPLVTVVISFVGAIFEVKTETDGKLETVVWAPVNFKLVWAPVLVFKFTVVGALGVVVIVLVVNVVFKFLLNVVEIIWFFDVVMALLFIGVEVSLNLDKSELIVLVCCVVVETFSLNELVEVLQSLSSESSR